MTLLSVLVPNYNHAEYLPRCLDSIFAQDDPACEIMVCDDGSSDASLEVLRDYQARYPKLKVLQNPKNVGVEVTISRLYQEAAGDYILGVGADDVLAPGYVAQLLQAIKKYQPPMLFPDIRAESPDFGVAYRLHYGDQARLWSGPELVRHFRQLPYFICGSTVHRAELLKAQLSTARQLGPLFDFWVNHSIAFLHGAFHIPGEFSVFAVRADSYGSRSRSRRVYKKFLDILAEPANRQLRECIRQSGILRRHGWPLLLAICSSFRDFDLLSLEQIFQACKTSLLGPFRRNFPKLYGKLVAILRGAKSAQSTQQG